MCGIWNGLELILLSRQRKTSHIRKRSLLYKFHIELLANGGESSRYHLLRYLSKVPTYTYLLVGSFGTCSQ